METMFLVVGLAIAGVVGIAAAFYFSIRSGSRGDKRRRSVGAGRAGTDRRPGGGSRSTARPDGTDNARRAANDGRPANTGRGANTSSRNYRPEASTGPNPVLDFGDPVPAGGPRGGPSTSAGDSQATDSRLATAVPGESRPGDTRPGSRSAARLSREAHAAEGAGRTTRPRRRGAFRKGADVDEELWPVESFGGVSDEQFWDDLASDKPLTTTARTAQQDPGTRNRPFDAAPPPTAVPSAAVPSAAVPSAAGAPTATQPVQIMTSQVPGATQPVRTAAGTRPPMSASQPVSAADQPSEPRGRRRASRSDDEDPLTSAAFSLRSSGPVDGRSSRRSRDMTRDQYDAAVGQETQTFSAAETEAASGGYPGGVPPFRQSESSAGSRSPSSYSGPSHGDPSSVTQAMNTPPDGEKYRYGGRGAQAQPDDPRRQDGTRSYARHRATGEATRTARQAYPQDGYQSTGSYPAGVYSSTRSYPAGGYPDGGHQGNGHPTGGYPGSTYQGNANAYRGNSHRAPYDPRDDYRRLTHLG